MVDSCHNRKLLFQSWCLTSGWCASVFVLSCGCENSWHKIVFDVKWLVRRVTIGGPRSGEPWTQKLKSLLVRTQSLNVLPLKPGVSSHTFYAYCQEFFPCLFLPFQSVHLHFFQNLSWFFPALAVANTSSCVGPQNKIGHPAGCRFRCWVPTEYK